MSTRIDWCDETINPLGWGCYGPTGTRDNPKPCSYCYAKRFAERNLRGCELCRQFIPHEHPEQLELLKKWKGPKTIFVQSMGDLFHDDIPDEWIQTVFKACEAAPQHRYLFLTKNPKVYKKDPVYSNCQISFKKNWWFGASITGSESKDDIAGTMIGLAYCNNSFLSIEPIQKEIVFYEGVCLPKWIIVGAETGNRKNKPVVCKWWIDKLVHMCLQYEMPIFMKESLRSLMGDDFKQEYPWKE